MDAWASGKYSGRAAFVCVSCDGAQLASKFVKELKLSKCTVTVAEDSPAWGQLGCSGFIMLDSDGRVTCRATNPYMEVRERAFDHVESLLDALLDGAKLPAVAKVGADFAEVAPVAEPDLDTGGV